MLNVGETDWEIANDKTLGVIFRIETRCQPRRLHLSASPPHGGVDRNLSMEPLLGPVDIVAPSRGRG